MATFGNIIWFLFTGGPIIGVIYYILGLILSVTVIFIPISKVLFNLGKLMFFPFGKTIIQETELKGKENISKIRRIGGLIANILWLPVGISFAIYHFLIGVVLYIFIITIPLAKVNFRIARIMIWPVGAKVVSIEEAKLAKKLNEERFKNNKLGQDDIKES